MVANLETIGPDIKSQPLNNNFAALNSAKMEKTADSDLDMNARSIRNLLTLHLRNATPLTISNGAITVTQTYHSVDTEGGAPTDDLDTINGGSVGDILILRGVSGARDVTIRHGVGNIYTWDGQNITLESGNLNIVLLVKMSATQWVVVGNPGIKRTGDRMSGNLEFAGNSRGFTFHNGDSETVAELANMPDVVTGNVSARLFRSTNTSGNKLFSILKGDGTATATFAITNGEITRLNEQSVTITAYPGNPNGNVAAPPGSICLNTSGGAGTSFYVKESGTGNTGWVAK